MKQLTLTECSKRSLDEKYIVVYAIKNEINVKEILKKNIRIHQFECDLIRVLG